MWTCKEDLDQTWKVIEAFADGEDFSDFTSRDKKQSIVDEVLCGTPYWPGDEYEAASPLVTPCRTYECWRACVCHSFILLDNVRACKFITEGVLCASL